VTLSCDDRDGSGCAATRYTTDGSTPTLRSPRYSAPIRIAATTPLKFFSVDARGNAEAVKTETYTFSFTDSTAPTVSASPTGGTYNTPQTVTLTCDDGSGTGCQAIRYTTDGTTPTTTSREYTAPLTVSANTPLRFFATDLAGNASPVVTETYFIDTTPPVVAATLASGAYNTPQSVVLRCSDPSGSGCAFIRYTVDGSTPTNVSALYSTALAVSATTTLKFVGIDRAGNASPVATETYVIDTVVPTVSASPAGGTYNSARSVTLSCNDGAGSGCVSIRYTTSGTTPTVASPQYTAPLVLSTDTTLKFIGIDRAGNTSSVVTEIYVIDTAPPTVTVSPRGRAYTTAQSVTLSCHDDTGSGCASIRYTTNGTTPTASSAQYSTALSFSANTTLKFIGIDNVGNVSPVVTEIYVIDGTAPIVAASPVGGSYNTARSVTLSCSDGTGSGCASIRYTLDGDTPTATSTRYTAPLNISGSTILKFIGIDNAGNVSPVETETYIIDSTAPTVAASPPGGTYNTAQNVTLSCQAITNCASIRYTTNGTTPTASSAQYSTPLTISANTTLKFIGIDNAGNISSVVTETYAIDASPPTVTASPGSGTYGASLSVTLSCNDGAGSGCTAIRYTLDGTTPTTTSEQYTAPLTFSTDTILKFIGTDRGGNSSPVVTQTYVIDLAAPTVTATPPGGAFTSAVNVTLSCDDRTGSGCAAMFYTTDGSIPTQSSSRYSAPLRIAASTSLSFIAIDNAGNESGVYTETYVIDSTAPTTSASPPGGVYGPAQTVTLACDSDAGAGCAATYYTVDGSTPTTRSTRYTAPLTVSARTTLKFFSVDAAGNAEAVKTQQYFIGTLPSDISAQIAAVRAAAAGTINLPIRLALVTYIKPAVGADVAGFFLQAEQPGPAVFIAVAPGTLSPVPMVGDRVSLVATRKAAPTNVGGMVHVTGISGFTVESRGEPVAPLRADVSSDNLSVAVDNYESEFIFISGTLLTAFASSGTGHVSSNLSTLGTPEGTNLQLRLPTTLRDQLDLVPDCSVTVEGPMWRLNAVAQPSGYVATDFTVLSCPAPKVVSAVAVSSTSVTVRLDRRIDPASVQANGSQFTFNNGLSARGATVQARDVLVTTSAQTSGRSYTVTVAPSVRDTQGTPLDAGANTATFNGK
jgi:hypothetical protein